MHNQYNIRFTLLVSWCCLLSISIVIMTVVFATGTNQNQPEERNSVAGLKGDRPASWKSPHSGQASVNNVHLVLNSNSTWVKSQLCFCENSSLILRNNSVTVTAGGYYFTSAQVTFKNITNKNNGDKGIMTLIANENVRGKTPRRLSQAEHGVGTVSMSMVILLRKGENVNLKISPGSMELFRDESKTHWSLFLITKQEDN